MNSLYTYKCGENVRVCRDARRAGMSLPSMTVVPLLASEVPESTVCIVQSPRCSLMVVGSEVVRDAAAPSGFGSTHAQLLLLLLLLGSHASRHEHS